MTEEHGTRSLAGWFVVLLGVFQTCQACTVFLAGKDATTDGSTMVSHSNDGEFDTDPRLVKVPAADYDPGWMRPVYFSPETYPRYVGSSRFVREYLPRSGQVPFAPIGFIPQVEHTFAYLEETYGAVNEHGVGIGENTCSGVFGAIPLGAPNGTAMFSIDALTQVAMERATTAREAIQIMGSLAEGYGFYGAGEFEGTAEALAVNDRNEVWIFHILPDPTGKSAIWAAQRIPDDSFAVMANMFVIRQVDPSDTDIFMMSDSVHQVAIDYGWWDPKDETLLDFTKIYSDGEYAHKYYSGRRMWGAYLLACPSCGFPDTYEDLQSDPVYPLYTKPDSLLTPTDFFRLHRYTYQGTKYSLGAAGNLAGGPFSSPDRWKAGPAEKIVEGNWERPIGLYRTSDTYVVQSKASSSLGAVLWFGPASSLGTVFTPFVVKLSDIPASYRNGHHAVFSRKRAFWAACVVHNIANLKWSYAIKDVEAIQRYLEDKSVVLVEQLDADYERNDNFEAVEASLLENAEEIMTALWNLSDQLLFKYASGFVNEPTLSQMVGYPEWWLKEVGYADGPPPPPTKPKCCHPAPNNSTSTIAVKVHTWEGRMPVTGKAAMKQYLRRNDAKEGLEVPHS